MKRWLGLVTAALAAGAAFAHGGEDHGDAAHGRVPAPMMDLAPRLVAATEDVELVGVLDADRLLLYVDRYASNEPVADAQVEVEGAGVAAQVAPGIYALPAGPWARPGRHGLSVSVQADDLADLLTGFLEVPAPAAAPPHVHSWDEWAVWSGAAVLVLGGGALVLRRRQRRRGGRS